jgi:hypothetical protein
MFLVLVMAFTAISCSNNSAGTTPTNPPGWTNPGLSDPNEKVETEITEKEDILNEFITTEIYLKEITEAEDKEVDYQCLEGVVREQCNGIIVIGQSTPLQRYLRTLNVDFTNVDSISEAVQLAYKKGNAGDCVIYSPCCKAADDAFALRSQRYTKAVRHL